ncbi:MAG: acyl carrier protein [Planctomycetes bacterium]|nr:acyl carrier protein [Planctomycetota bacterium]
MTEQRWNEHSILAEIRGYIVASFRDGRGQGIDALTPLVASGILDSAGVLQVVEFLERRFHIQIADEEVGLANFHCIGALARMVAGKVAPPPGET